ncbi:RNA polymerase sigma factor [Streptomyces sp. NPDC002265]|uniref:RNA polymerase sigma factor n=1 Tax=Streptomyces sp. NPDC002265 TaxID=3154415 RepID=UPI00332618B7
MITPATPALRWQQLLHHHDRIHRLARSRLRGAAEAEDCAQEALLRAAAFDALDESRIGPFLTSVTLRLCTDVHRREERARRLLRRVLPGDPTGPEEVVCAEAEDAWMLRQVGRLTGLEREVMLARREGMSTREYAARNGVSAKAAEGAYTRARARLRRWYAGSLTG